MPPPDSSADHLRRLLAELGISPSRRRGQNFLHDRNIARKIGPGLGALTSLLAAAQEKTVAVEVDRRLAAYLQDRFAGSAVEVVEADVLSVPEEEGRRGFPDGGTGVGHL